eukprot:436107-Prorocentrum_minimum.AAC.3
MELGLTEMSWGGVGFQTLGVAEGADAAEIKRAFREQCKRWHPDRQQHGQKPEDQRRATTQFKRVNEAYQVRISSLNLICCHDLTAQLRRIDEAYQVLAYKSSLVLLRVLTRRYPDRYPDCYEEIYPDPELGVGGLRVARC